jgi:hypothetical protein
MVRRQAVSGQLPAFSGYFDQATAGCGSTLRPGKESLGWCVRRQSQILAWLVCGAASWPKTGLTLRKIDFF